jgi:hypothetical protein
MLSEAIDEIETQSSKGGRVMLIVCTQDQVIRETAANPASGGPAWAPIVQLPVGPQPRATTAFAESLQGLGAHEPLCLSAHGNDNEIGDAEDGWSWSTAEVAELLEQNAPGEWDGPVLIHACAENVTNFSAGLAVALEMRDVFQGLWCYGYNRSVPANAGFPPPAGLPTRVELQGTQV